MEISNKIQGSLIGGAIGDALGYPIEFTSSIGIKQKYGQNGITELRLVNEQAVVSDDTQMTLFTVEGILECKDKDFLKRIRRAYIDWYMTQTRSYYDIKTSNLLEDSRLLRIKELYRKRAPGETCMTSIYHGCDGTIYNHINNSKGCGGVMRVAPIGLAFNPDKTGKSFINRLGAEAAALTHGHPLGYMSAFVLVSIVNDLVNTNMDIEDAVKNAIINLKYEFGYNDYVSDINEILMRAVNFANNGKSNDEIYIEGLGEGWVAEEALAIAVYCSIKYKNNFEKAIITSVNHDGDSDSTGAITGNIIGAYLGVDNIPSRWKEKVEFNKLILELGERLYNFRNS